MKWLKDNPLGMALLGVCGVLVLVALVLTIVWTLPEDAQTDGQSANAAGGDTTLVSAQNIADISEYQLINDKPVFNETRQPEIEEEEPGDDTVPPPPVEVRDAPDVKLTGVIITPSMKIASLTPADNNLDGIMAHEGQILEGEFVGWQVSSVSPRAVVLESRDGQTLDLELEVHDATIKQPPKPVAPAAKPDDAAKAAAIAAAREELLNEDGEPLTRAEQIRQRIAERREELRREQEIQQAKRGLQAQSDALSAGAQREKPQDYQSAIRAMLQNNRNQRSEQENDG